MRKKISVEQLKELLNGFNSLVVPWCEDNGYSLHKAFEACREGEAEDDKQRYYILSELWSCQFGKLYLKDYFRTRGGILRKKEKKH
jgi:hypothetical protein